MKFERQKKTLWTVPLTSKPHVSFSFIQYLQKSLGLRDCNNATMLDEQIENNKQNSSLLRARLTHPLIQSVTGPNNGRGKWMKIFYTLDLVFLCRRFYTLDLVFLCHIANSPLKRKESVSKRQFWDWPKEEVEGCENPNINQSRSEKSHCTLVKFLYLEPVRVSVDSLITDLFIAHLGESETLPTGGINRHQ